MNASLLLMLSGSMTIYSALTRNDFIFDLAYGVLLLAYIVRDNEQ